MKLSEKDVANRAEEAVRTCLAGIPFLKVTRIKRKPSIAGTMPDLAFKISSPASDRVLILEVRNNGEPRLAREAVNKLLRYFEKFPNAYGVFLAPYVSPKAAEICAREGIGYMDLSGNCRLCFDNVYVEREGKPNKFAEKRDLRTLYSPKATRVLRVLLNEPKKLWKVMDLAREAGVSLGLASNVKKLLANREWIRGEKNGFALDRPVELLAEWSANYSFRRNEARDYYSLKSTAEIEVSLAEVCSDLNIRYALTSFSAAARIAPSVTYQRVFAYLDDHLEDVASRLELKEVDSGPNVTLLRPFDEGVFYGTRDIEGVRTVSDVQAYLDLKGFRGRGDEAAGAILDQVIIPRW